MDSPSFICVAMPPPCSATARPAAPGPPRRSSARPRAGRAGSRRTRPAPAGRGRVITKPTSFATPGRLPVLEPQRGRSVRGRCRAIRRSFCCCSSSPTIRAQEAADAALPSSSGRPGARTRPGPPSSPARRPPRGCRACGGPSVDPAIPSRPHGRVHPVRPDLVDQDVGRGVVADAHHQEGEVAEREVDPVMQVRHHAAAEALSAGRSGGACPATGVRRRAGGTARP